MGNLPQIVKKITKIMEKKQALTNRKRNITRLINVGIPLSKNVEAINCSEYRDFINGNANYDAKTCFNLIESKINKT